MKPVVKKTLAIIAAVLLAFLFYCYAETFWLETTNLEFKNAAVPLEFSGKKIVFAADFHCGIFFDEKRLAGVVGEINRLEPDIIILGGDYVDYDKSYIAPTFDELAKLKAKMGVYAVLGNRDYQTDPAAIRAAMASASIKLLENDGEWIEAGGQKIRLGGVADFLQARANAAPALADATGNDFVVLASHNPTYVDRIDTANIDLILSGHTHGGQMTLFGLWVPFFDLKYGHKYQSGIYRKDGATILVSNGIGTRLLPLRFFARPQINVITLGK